MWATEWKMEDALKVRAKEAWEDGREEGRVEGLEEGLEKGREEGFEEGLEKAKVEMAQKMLGEGFDANTVSRISGLTVDAVMRLKPAAK